MLTEHFVQRVEGQAHTVDARRYRLKVGVVVIVAAAPDYDPEAIGQCPYGSYQGSQNGYEGLLHHVTGYDQTRSSSAATVGEPAPDSLPSTDTDVTVAVGTLAVRTACEAVGVKLSVNCTWPGLG